MVQHYCDLWPRHSEILLPINLTKDPKKRGPIEWTPECESAFERIKHLIARDTILAYPDFNKKFRGVGARNFDIWVLCIFSRI